MSFILDLYNFENCIGFQKKMSSSSKVMILIDAPIPDYSTQSFRYVLEWDLETFPSPLEFVKSVAMEMRLDDVGSTSLSQISLSLVR